MKQAFFLLFLLLFCSYLSADELFDKLYQKYSKVYDTHKGVKSTRELTAISKDPETGNVLKKFSAKIVRLDYFYKTPDITALEYSENGEPGNKKDYDTREIEPFYPVFDKNGKKNYRLERSGFETVNGIKCVRIKVTPAKKSARHFSGFIYVDPVKLELIKLKGTVAKFHWAMKQYDFEYLYYDFNGFHAVKAAKITARVKVVLFVSDNITDYEVKVLSNSFF